ncbi:MAG: VOC family protein [Hyphomicrobiaceae bacterium]
MPISPNHMSIVVNDVGAAKDFLLALGFQEQSRKMISGPVMEQYLGVRDMEAEHTTMILKDADPYFDIQILKYQKPSSPQNEHIRDLSAIGYNHFGFAVDDLDKTLRDLAEAGVEKRSETMEFRDHKMALLWGPEGLTFELVQKLP